LANLPIAAKQLSPTIVPGWAGSAAIKRYRGFSKPTNKSGSFAIFAAIRRANQSCGVLLRAADLQYFLQ
jgi:hypothetical protein